MKMHAHSVLSIAAAVCAALSGGCRTAPVTPAPAAVSQRSNDTAGYVAAFNAGDFSRAAELTDGRRHEAALLIRAMSLAQLGRQSEAEPMLRRLSQSRDSAIRARALATLGLLEHSRGRFDRAAPKLAEASRGLNGTDAVWAAHYAAKSYRAIGNIAAAAELERLASPTLSSTASGSSDGSFAIQFGSFSSETRAKRHQQSMRLVTRRNGLPEPTVHQVERGGRTLYAVRSNGFSSADSARSAADRLRTDTTVVALR
ncbi:MAG: SPOR domain-containing protein [Planctomycetota bacterium]